MLCLFFKLNQATHSVLTCDKLLQIYPVVKKGANPAPDMTSLLNFILFSKHKQIAMSCVRRDRKITQLHFIQKIQFSNLKTANLFYFALWHHLSLNFAQILKPEDRSSL